MGDELCDVFESPGEDRDRWDRSRCEFRGGLQEESISLLGPTTMPLVRTSPVIRFRRCGACSPSCACAEKTDDGRPRQLPPQDWRRAPGKENASRSPGAGATAPPCAAIHHWGLDPAAKRGLSLRNGPCQAAQTVEERIQQMQERLDLAREKVAQLQPHIEAALAVSAPPEECEALWKNSRLSEASTAPRTPMHLITPARHRHMSEDSDDATVCTLTPRSTAKTEPPSAGPACRSGRMAPCDVQPVSLSKYW